LLVWFVMGAGVVAYALTGGADFGGGIWHLFARGPKAAEQKKLIERAIAPIWEANHVWLIFVIVLLFSAFPRAFAVIATALHVPIGVALLGIVMRGSAFVFHAYDLRPGPRSTRWATTFGVSSLFTPLALGDVLGAVSTGAIRWDGTNVTSGFASGWPTPFALATGLFATLLFMLLAAVYLAAEAEGALAETFRRRALAMEAIAGAAAFAVFALSASGAPELYAGLADSTFTVPIQLVTAVAAFSTMGLLYRRKFSIARFTAASQVALVVVGWGLAMGNRIVVPDVTLENAGVNPGVVGALLVALAAGAALLAPSLWYLYRVFKSGYKTP
jgi:cytochrome d ubiquinol oxidase subunit II